MSDLFPIIEGEDSGQSSFDLLKVPLVGRILHWRHSRTMLQVPLLLISMAMILHGILGPDLSPKNLATVLTWVHFRGVLVLVLLIAGNFFCMGCPFMLVRNFARRWVQPRWIWPRMLRNKWIAVVLFALVLFCYELFALWSSPSLTAWIIVAYFASVLIVDSLFKHASFCKYVCPIGQFNFLAATVSPLEIRARERSICSSCQTKDCIRGRRDPETDQRVVQRGCELALFVPEKIGNMDCTLCLDCVHACPSDNIGILSRLPAAELTTDARRSGVGIFSRRKDIAALAIVFCFGALMNAFGMVSPVYRVESWMAGVIHLHELGPILAILFGLVLVVAPAVLLGAAARTVQAWAGVKRQFISIVVRYSYCLVPLGFGMWLAHYGFHFLTGLYTIVPVTQSAVMDLGFSWLGQPQWTLVGIPQYIVEPLEFGFLLLGFAGSIFVAWQLAEEDSDVHPVRAFVPWALVCVILLAACVWLMMQPMDMRATMMAG